jgi:hypothetical protein
MLGHPQLNIRLYNPLTPQVLSVAFAHPERVERVQQKDPCLFTFQQQWYLLIIKPELHPSDPFGIKMLIMRSMLSFSKSKKKIEYS